MVRLKCSVAAMIATKSLTILFVVSMLPKMSGGCEPRVDFLVHERDL